MYKISKETRDSIVAYLAERPYKEVANGMMVLANLEEIKEIVIPEVKAEELK